MVLTGRREVQSWSAGRWVLGVWHGANRVERLESRQQRYTRRSLGSFVVISLSKRTEFRLLIQSKQLHQVQVHWFGRTLLCPGGDDCPACYCSRPKTFWYCAATINRQIELVEMCESLGSEVRSRIYQDGAQTLEGWIVGASRRTVRMQWSIKELCQQRDLVCSPPESLLINRFGKLYQLPLQLERATPDLTFVQYLESAKKCHISALAKLVVPM